MPEHIVTAYDKELEALGRKIAEMGGIAEKMLSDAMDALIALDVDLAEAVVAERSRASTCCSGRSRKARS